MKLDLTSLNYINWRIIDKRENPGCRYRVVVLARRADWDYLVLVVVALPRLEVAQRGLLPSGVDVGSGGG